MKTWNKSRVYEFAHLKRDGHQLLVSRDDAGKVTATSRIGTDLTEKLKPYLANVYRYLPNGSIIAGETWLPGVDASQIKTAINRQDPNLRFDVFAVLQNPEVPAERLAKLSLYEADEMVSKWGLTFMQFVAFGANTTPEHVLDFVTRAEKDDYDTEGFVFKVNHVYDWVKWKPRRTIDLIVKGYEDGKGKYLGLVGNLICETSEGYELCKVSGMTDAQRIDISLYKKKYLGCVVEVEYQTVLCKGRLRHPRFKRFRDDKSPDACNVYQDSRLSEYWEK